MLRALALAAALGLCADDPWKDGVEREWTVREWALAPREHRAAIEAALEDENWEVRHAAFDALARAAPEELFEGAMELAADGLDDAHPNVRRRALVAHAAFSDESLDERAPALADDTFAGARHELASALRFLRADAGDDALLERLSRDGDRRVAKEAATVLLQRGPESVAAQLALIARWREQAGEAGELRALELLELAPANDALLDAELPGRDRALWEALSFAGRGRGDAGVLAMEWWGADLGRPRDRELELRRRAFLLRCARGFDETAASTLLGAARTTGRAQVDPALARELLSAALAVSEVADTVLMNDAPRFAEAELRVATWEGLLTREMAWEGQAGWLVLVLGLETDPDVRFAVTSGLAGHFARSGESRAGDLLAELLGDEDSAVRGEAFRALGRAKEPRWIDALHAAWLALGTEQRLIALRDISRNQAPTPFRDQLIELWESGAGRSASVLELLSAFRADEQLAERLEAWLDLELAYLSAHAPPPEEERSGPWRAAEGRAVAICRALSRSTREAAVPVLERALRATDGRSVEIAKRVAGLLGHSAAGRARLAEWIDSDASSRVRIEAALQVASEQPDAAVSLLLDRYPSCDEELRVRTLRAFGALSDPRCVSFLGAQALAPASTASERVIALEALLASPRREAVRDALIAICEAPPDLDALRAAIAGLGELGDPAALPTLRELAADVERREHLHDELLPALARLDPAGTAGELFDAPLAAARDELEVRFRAGRLPARDFQWRGEIAAAEILAVAGELAAALEERPEWSRIDARLLVVLGDAALSGGAREIARRFFHAARAGFEGEAPASDLEGLRARARSRGLALAVADRRWAQARRLARELLADLRSGVTTRREWEEVLDSAAGAGLRAALYWVEATELQARAWLAHAQGRDERARALAKLAAEPAKKSTRAAAQQTALESSLR